MRSSGCSRARHGIGIAAVVAVALGGCGGRAPSMTGRADGAPADRAGASAHDAEEERDAGAAEAVEVARDAGAAETFQLPRDAGFAGTIEAFCDEEARLWCAFLARCHHAFATEEDCRTVEKARCFAPVGAWQERAAGQGRVALVDSNVAACLDQIATFSCSVQPERPSACAAPAVGTVADGQPCVRAGECRGGICDIDGVCPGKCRSPVPLGGLCATAADCEQPNASCVLPPNQLLCVTDSGAPACRCASRGGPGASCTNDLQCLAGLRCDAGMCLAPAAARGDVCGFQVGCAGDLACLRAPNAPAQTALGVCGDRLPEGAPCVGEPCRAGLHCQFAIGGSVCRPDARLGEACDFQMFCPLGAFCDANVCRPRPKSGESCADVPSDACWGPNLICAAIGGLPPMCLPAPTINQSCAGLCADGVCTNGICRGKLAAGERCDANSECASDRCKLPDPDRCQGAGCSFKVCTVVCTWANE